MEIRMTAPVSASHKGVPQSVCWNFKLLAHHDLAG
jgi:hypothetical protein